ncbi:S8 family serine peptidase [Streptomyces vinaceus]|uniref:S8 family serine peptidase n=1 Tax=Streptomyces vinaceus TaxID=1960 RepID=UPI0035E2AAEE
MRLLVRLATATLLTITPAAAGTAFADTPGPTPAPLHTAANAIPGRYIVTLDATRNPAQLAKELGVKPTLVYSTALTGFAAPLTKAQLDTVRRIPGVKSVDQDATVSASPAPSPAGSLRSPTSSWGLDRIDQRHLPLDHNFSTAGSGQGVTAYIIDSGIDFTHPDFGGRARAGFDAIGDGRDGADCNGHGTHVAGTVGGATFGVARKRQGPTRALRGQVAGTPM